MLETAAIADRVTLNLQLEGFLEMADEESSVDGWGGRKTSDEQGSETFDLETSSPFAGRDDKVKYGDNDSEDSSDGELTFCERVYVCLYGIDPEMRSSWQKFNAYLGFQTERTGWLDTAGRAVALGLMIATAGLLYGVISLGYYFFSERSVNMLELGIDRVVAENKKRVEKQIRQFRLEADNMARDTWISVYNPDTGEYQSSKGDDDGKYKSSEGNVNVFDV
jgi:hypothetical protein